MFVYFVISHDLPTDKCSFISLYLSIYIPTNVRLFRYISQFTYRYVRIISLHLTIYLSVNVRIVSLHPTIYLSINVRIVSLHPTIYLPTNVRLFRYISRFTYRQMFVYFVTSHYLPTVKCSFYFVASHDLITDKCLYSIQSS